MQRGLAETRERAQALILAGAVRIGDELATKPGQAVAPDAPVTLQSDAPPYVSRGGLKLVAALERWRMDPADRVALDVGASTGGFTDALLQAGARRVYAVDVGYGQLHYRLRNDPRVVVMERTNVRSLTSLPEQPQVAAVDVSFISLRLVVPPVLALLRPDAPVVALVKPQFEAGRGQVGKGGVVRDPVVHRQVLSQLGAWSAAQPWRLADLMASPIRGPAGNVEFLSLWLPGAEPVSAETVERALAEAALVGARTR